MTRPTASRNGAPRAVLVCEEVPVAGTNGAGSYNLTILRALRSLGWRVDLLVTGRRLPGRMPEADWGGRVDFLHARKVGPFLVPTSPGALARSAYRLAKRFRPSGEGQGKRIAIGRFLGEAEVRAAGRLLAAAPPDAIFVDTIFRSGVLAAAPAETRHRILIGHDVFHHRVASLRANGFEATPAVDRSTETRLYGQFSGVVSINSGDDRTAREMAPGARHATVLPAAGGSGRQLAADGRPGAGNRLFYLGSVGAHNVDGLAWFLTSVWPAVRGRLPDATLEVAGAIAERFPDPVEGVTFHGRVKDLEGLASRCAAAINPVRMGSGIKIKMVDYFSLGLTCVATPKAAEGFPDDPAPPFRTAGEEAFGEAVVAHLTDVDARVALAGRIPDYLTLFSDRAAADRIADLLAD